jgi:hypothetical protein
MFSVADPAYPATLTHLGDPMTRRDDQRIADLAKKNAAKVKPPRQEQAADFDPTLRPRAPEQDAETRRLFKEMKRREF